MGCDFAVESCGSWSTGGGYFCDKDGTEGCTPDLVGKGQCVVNTYATALPPDNQYFSNPKQGGASSLADYCPYVTAYENGWCFDAANNDEFAIIDNAEYFSDNSRCFLSTLVKNIPFGGDEKPVCYETYCTGDNELNVRVGRNWYNCPSGASIRVVGYGGVLFCPVVCMHNFSHHIQLIF